MSEGSEPVARWQGRNPDKDFVRTDVWSALETNAVAIGTPWSRIPNFVGADRAAARLAELEIWKRARIVKSNPDAPQIPVRQRALEDGKLVYTPAPELVADFPFVLLDPELLARHGVPFAEAAVSDGALRHGQPVQFQEMMPMDLIVVGCVAVTRRGGRMGKGGGFADLELGIFRELGLVPPTTPIITTVHPLQVVDDERVLMVAHDSPLDWIITPDEVIETRTQYPQPTGVNWDAVQPDQFRDIPFLVELRSALDRKP